MSCVIPSRDYPSELLYTRALIHLSGLAKKHVAEEENLDSLKDQARGLSDYLARIFCEPLVSDELMQYYQCMVSRGFRESRCCGE
jgi:hypothetical protein